MAAMSAMVKKPNPCEGSENSGSLKKSESTEICTEVSAFGSTVNSEAPTSSHRASRANGVRFDCFTLPPPLNDA